MAQSDAKNSEFEDRLAEALEQIDHYLAQRGVKLASRPLYAAIDFVDYFVIRIGRGKSEEFEPGGFEKYIDSDWFKIIYARTTAWYKDRYTLAMDADRIHKVRGATIILQTPFIIDVPLITIEPDEPGKTVWMCYHDSVKKHEDPFSWVEMCPNISKIQRSDGLKARRTAVEIAGNLRAAYIRLMPIDISDGRVTELRDNVLPNLERAAEQIVRNGMDDFKRAFWDMQMACESVLKLLAQQRAGSFQETHDLYVLYDRMPVGKSPFIRRWLSDIPHWERMAEWRYGGGSPILLADTFRVYRAALRIVASAAAAARRQLDFSKARFKISKAPFLHGDPSMFEPRK